MHPSSLSRHNTIQLEVEVLEARQLTSGLTSYLAPVAPPSQQAAAASTQRQGDPSSGGGGDPRISGLRRNHNETLVGQRLRRRGKAR